VHPFVLTTPILAGGLFAGVVLVTEADARSAHQGTPSHHESGALSQMSGRASVYGGSARYGGSRTASGEHVARGGLTAAHRSLPLGTMVKVTNRRNGRSVVVRVNDRGPFVRGRVIDVTPAAARVLGFSGIADVSLAVVSGR